MYILIIAIVIVIGIIAGAAYLFISTIPRSENSRTATKMSGGSWDKHRTLLDKSRKWLDAAECECASIKSFDNLTLSGYYYPAKNNNGCLVMAFNGYRSESRGQYSHITQYLNIQGFDVVLIDDRAHGSSEGKYVGFGVLDRLDCKKWIEFINEKLDHSRKIYLYGVSMGAATVLMASGPDLPKEVKGVIADCGFTTPYAVFKHVLNKNYHLPAFPLLNISNLFCRVFAKYDFRGASAIEAVEKSTLPLLVIHGENDTFVPAYMGPEIYNASNSRYKKLLMVKDAYHAESYFIDMETYRKTMIEFINDTKERQGE